MTTIETLSRPTTEYIGRAPCGCALAICGIWPDADSARSAARVLTDWRKKGLIVEILPRVEAIAAFSAGLECQHGHGNPQLSLLPEEAR